MSKVGVWDRCSFGGIKHRGGRILYVSLGLVFGCKD